MHRKHLSASNSSQSPSANNIASINNGKRRRMVAEATYFRAQHHNFQSYDINDDWYHAESEIDAILTKMKAHQPTARE